METAKTMGRGLDSKTWLSHSLIPEHLDSATLQALSGLKPLAVPAKTVLFHPGTKPQGFLILLSGRIEVYMTGKSGRELLLYSIVPGETCVQTTLALMGDEPYSAEAVAETDLTAILVPYPLFKSLMNSSEAFRRFVFRAFANRVSDVMYMLEQVAFVGVENRLAAVLLERADADGVVKASHQELAVSIGSVREVISRHLKTLAARGFIKLDRRHILILDRGRLDALSRHER
jgi:CRP/FNR family transcriptional regulator